MKAECCGHMLERVVSSGSRGLSSIGGNYNPSLSPSPALSQSLVWLVTNNFFIKSFRLSGLGVVESAFKRNVWLERNTHNAAPRVLKAARVILLGSPGPSRASSQLGRPCGRTHLFDLPPEILQVVMSFFYPGTLSDRQISSVLQHAADRTTLLPRTIELKPFYPSSQGGQISSQLYPKLQNL